MPMTATGLDITSSRPKRLLEVFSGLSRTINAATGGRANETLSARAYRERHQRSWLYHGINAIFRPFARWWPSQRNHCATAWAEEVMASRLTLQRDGQMNGQ